MHQKLKILNRFNTDDLPQTNTQNRKDCIVIKDHPHFATVTLALTQ